MKNPTSPTTKQRKADIISSTLASTKTSALITTGTPMKNASLLGPDYSVDKRKEARKEHTNHFTNRAAIPKKK